MKFRFVPTPSFAWVLIPVLILLKSLGIFDTWTAIGIFVVYVIGACLVMWRNPRIRAEAERFAQQVGETQSKEKKDALSEALRKSVRIRRRDD